MRLHHIGYLTKDMTGAVSRFEERFGYRPVSEVIHDPLQTAWVRFLHLPGADHYLELVSPAGEGSKLAAAAAKGVTLHHLCYEVDNIEAAADRLRERQLLMVGTIAPAVAFGGRRIAWFMDADRLLCELVEAGEGPLSLATIPR
jgi:methylmalonyl-CoA/ethylmalonyl-CoA epimerase